VAHAVPLELWKHGTDAVHSLLRTPLDVLTCRDSLQVGEDAKRLRGIALLAVAAPCVPLWSCPMPTARDGRTSGSHTALAATSESGSEQTLASLGRPGFGANVVTSPRY
jgi:hypothetical protein